MITPLMRIDNCLTDLTGGSFGSIAFTSDIENVARELYNIGKTYEATNMLVTYGRLQECTKRRQCKIIESLKLFLTDARMMFKLNGHTA